MGLYTKAVQCAVLVAFLLALFSVHAQADTVKCVPGSIPTVELFANYNIRWSEAQNPNNCTINNYVLYIHDMEDGTTELFTTYKTVLTYNLNFLDMCKSYTFEVHALTDKNVLGPAKSVAYTTSPSTNMNLNVTLANATVDANEITVSWALNQPEVTRCVSYYRVIYWDEDNNPTDVYVTKFNFSLAGDIPCMEYAFQVSAIVHNPDIEGPVSEIKVAGFEEPPSPPTLLTLSTTNTSVTLSWQLENYSKNRCQNKALHAFTLGAPASVSNVTVPISDNPNRPEISFTLEGLSPDTAYITRVYVENNAGPSKNVSITYQTSDAFNLVKDQPRFFINDDSY